MADPVSQNDERAQTSFSFVTSLCVWMVCLSGVTDTLLILAKFSSPLKPIFLIASYPSGGQKIRMNYFKEFNGQEFSLEIVSAGKPLPSYNK